jgi:probable rRNA maturation factor
MPTTGKCPKFLQLPSVVPAPGVEGPDRSDAAEAEPPIGLVLDIVHDAGAWDAFEHWVSAAEESAAAVAAELPGAAQGAACIALSSDAEVQELNAAYRDKPSPTNVLSFPVEALRSDPDTGAPLLGDIILAHETILREADSLGIPLEHHFRHLVVHGLLHLLGFDHETDAEAKVMEAHEVRILKRMGIADPYEGAAAAEPGRHTEP